MTGTTPQAPHVADFCVKPHTSPKRATSEIRGREGSSIRQRHSLIERDLLSVVPLYGTGSSLSKTILEDMYAGRSAYNPGGCAQLFITAAPAHRLRKWMAPRVAVLLTVTIRALVSVVLRASNREYSEASGVGTKHCLDIHGTCDLAFRVKNCR